MSGARTAWRRTWLVAIALTGIVALGASGCNLKTEGAKAKPAETTAAATQAPADDKTSEAASEEKSETTESAVTSKPAPSSNKGEKPKKTKSQKTESKKTESSSSGKSKDEVYYGSCKEAKAAGAAPMREGEPGYRIGLDRDRDGIACDK